MSGGGGKEAGAGPEVRPPTTEGPSLDALTHRLAETPPAFLGAPRLGDRSGEVYVDAVVGDLLFDHGLAPTAEDVAPFAAGEASGRNWLRLVSVAAWLAHASWFRESGDHARAIRDFLAAGLRELATHVAAELFTTDPDRREELARLLLRHLELRPEGESEQQAADRLDTVSTLERARVLREMRAQRERAKQLREEMERQRAREAAAKYSRE